MVNSGGYTFEGYGREFVNYLKKYGQFDVYEARECPDQGFDFVKLYNFKKSDGRYLFSMPGKQCVGMKHYYVTRVENNLTALAFFVGRCQFQLIDFDEPWVPGLRLPSNGLPSYGVALIYSRHHSKVVRVIYPFYTKLSGILRTKLSDKLRTYILLEIWSHLKEVGKL